VPDSEMMRDLLSKMYYNFGQSLRVEGRIADAADAALKRRALWKGNGERLLGVATELAELGDASKKQPSGSKDTAPKDLDDNVIKTLELAYESGWPRTIDVATEKRFAGLQSNPRFSEKVAELNARSSHSRTRDDRGDGSPAKRN